MPFWLELMKHFKMMTNGWQIYSYLKPNIESFTQFGELLSWGTCGGRCRESVPAGEGMEAPPTFPYLALCIFSIWLFLHLPVDVRTSKPASLLPCTSTSLMITPSGQLRSGWHQTVLETKPWFLMT